MSDSFPLRGLPAQALQRVCQVMNKFDLITLSLCSKNAGKLIRMQNICPDEYEVIFTECSKTIRIKFNGNAIFNWELAKTMPNDVYANLLHLRQLTNIQRTENGIVSLCTESTSDAAHFYNMLSFFQQTFPAIIANLTVDLNFGILNTNQRNNEFLQLLGRNSAFCKNINLTGRSDAAYLTYALENIHVHETVTIDAKMPASFMLPKSLNVQCLIIKRADWISSNNLSSLNAGYCCLEQVWFDLNGTRRVLSQFLNFATSPMMGWLTVEVTADVKDVIDIVAGFPTMEYDSSIRNGYFTQFHGDRLQDIDCRNGLDIERSDGLLATVLLNPGKGGYKQFHLIIWHKRFPNSENMKRKMQMVARLSDGAEERNAQIREKERKIEENEQMIKRLTLEIDELKAENTANQMNRDAFKNILETIARTKGKPARK